MYGPSAVLTGQQPDGGVGRLTSRLHGANRSSAGQSAGDGGCFQPRTAELVGGFTVGW